VARTQDREFLGLSVTAGPYVLRRRAWRGRGAIRASDCRPTVFSPRSMGWFTEGFDTLELKRAKALLTS
jgi:hypothetical protein